MNQTTKAEAIEQKVMDLFDGLVSDLTPEDYREAIEHCLSSFLGRLECLKEESEN